MLKMIHISLTNFGIYKTNTKYNIIGIDLGYTNSRISIINDNKIKIITN
jgi:molecular chaperone DnaK (HSP70)